MTVNKTIRPLVHRRCRGFSLMEVLVALLVLAIGLLGLAALQTQGLRFNQGAYVRSQATILAYDIMDSMRAARGNATNDLTSYEQVPADPDLACDPTAPSIDMDLSCWFDALVASLGTGATGSVTQQAAPADDYWDVTVFWVDREPRDFAGTVRLPSTEGECEARAARTWDAISSSCLVTQTWTFWP